MSLLRTWWFDPSVWAPFVPLLLLPVAVFLTYWDALHGTWLIDDQAGMAVYDGVWQQPWWHWGNAFKKFRWEFGKRLNPQWQDHGQPRYLPDAARHHRLSLYLFTGVLGLLYLFLARCVSWPVAALTTALFLVHPLGPQVVAWISGIGYLMGAFFMLLGFNVAYLAVDYHWLATPLGVVGSLLAYGVCQFLACQAMFQMFQAVFLLVFLQLWPFAVIAGLIAGVAGWTTFNEAVTLRANIFKEQQMGQSTRLYPQKAIVALKTLAYYARLVIFPKRMGLYHTWGYHYEVPEIERETHLFWEGCLWCLAILAGILWGPWPVRLACLWFSAFICLFLNWITAMQFVTERYSWLPALGFCLLVAVYAPLWAGCLLLGLYLMRLWVHLPTFKDEWNFYYSNLFNFPVSEVAAGNMGVAFVNRGLVAAAMDWWMHGVHLNPHYDVNWYNLSSIVRTHSALVPFVARQDGMRILPQEIIQDALQTPELTQIKLARYLLERALRAKTCHFPKLWVDELRCFDMEIRWWYQSFVQPPEQRVAWQRAEIARQLALPTLEWRNVWEVRQQQTDRAWQQQEVAKAQEAAKAEAMKGIAASGGVIEGPKPMTRIS